MNRLSSIDIRKMQWKVNISVLPQKKKKKDQMKVLIILLISNG